jgi:5-(carboxyamino)imidazole ribonucleotide mutase
MKVLIICGSKSDMHVAAKASNILDLNNVSNEVQIASAHRTPEKVKDLVKNSEADVFIAIAGLSAALPGFIASITDKPVIGVPVDVKLDGLDALLSSMQMPSGVPVATVGIDNGKNAAFLAIRILRLKYPKLK